MRNYNDIDVPIMLYYFIVVGIIHYRLLFYIFIIMQLTFY